MKSSVWLISLGLAALLGCASEIGDACQDNVDCSPTGERICDLSQLEGYCTVQGCSVSSCAKEAVCVTFFPIGFLTTPCDPETEDAVGDHVKPTDDCRSDETCLSSGLCAQMAQEERFCMRRCSGSGDCRSGYECAMTGVAGAEALPDPDGDAAVSPQRFCRQKREL